MDNDAPDEELNNANYLIVGRNMGDRHLLVIFDTAKTAQEAEAKASHTAKQFPTKPIWVFEMRDEMRASIVVARNGQG